MQPQKGIPKLWVLFFCLCVGFAAYKIMLAWAGLPDWSSLLEQFPTYALPAVVGFSVAGYFARFLAWHANLVDLGHRLPLLSSLQCYLTGYLFLVTPARAGLSVRAFYLRDQGVPYSSSAAALLIERFNDIVATFVLSLLVFNHTIQWLGPMALGVGLLLLAAIAIFALARKGRLSKGPLGLSAPWLQRRLEPLRAVWRNTSGLLRKPGFWRSQALVVAGFMLYGLGLYVALTGLLSDISPWATVGVYAFSTVVNSFSFIPVGLGGTEATMVLLLSLFQVGQRQSVSAIILSRLGNVWLMVLLGAIATALIALRKRLAKS